MTNNYTPIYFYHKTPCTLHFYINNNNHNHHHYHKENKNDNLKKKYMSWQEIFFTEYRPFQLHQIDPHLVVGEGSQHSPKYLRIL